MINRRNFLAWASIFAGAGLAKFVSKIVPAIERVVPPSETEESDDWNWWKKLPRKLILKSDDPLLQSLCQATRQKRRLTILYSGGSEPELPRAIVPLGVFTVEGHSGVYVHAYCLRREAERTFRADRIVALA